MSLAQNQPRDLTTSPGCPSLLVTAKPIIVLLFSLFSPQEGSIYGCAGVFLTRLQRLALT